jgi:hypothetical protein
MADGKSTKYVTLVSNDGFEFKILRSAACIAGTIKKALDPLCKHLYLTCTPYHKLTIYLSRLQGKRGEHRPPSYD